MVLLREIKDFFLWLLKVTKRFLLASPFLFLTNITLLGLTRAMRVLAFVIPLRVIFLLSSESTGGGRYFGNLINEGNRETWIIVLAVLSLVFLIAATVFEPLAERVSYRLSQRTIARTNKTLTIPRQDEVGRRHCYRISKILADAIFSFLGILVIGLLNYSLFYFLIIFYILSFGAILFLLRNITKSHGKLVPMTELEKWVFTKFKFFITLVGSIGFLTSFLFILYLGFTGAIESIILLVLAFLILRQVFKASEVSINSSVQVYKAKNQVERLYFMGAHLKKNEAADVATFQYHFTQEKRTERVKNALLACGAMIDEETEVISKWHDSFIKHAWLFDIKTGDKSFIQIVVTERNKHLIEREKLLFKYVKREELGALPYVTEFEEKGFYSLVLDSTGCTSITKKEWLKNKDKIMNKIMAYQPSKELIKQYEKSAATLHHALTRKNLEKLSSAVENEEEAQLLNYFIKNINTLKKCIEKIPLYLHNPRLNHENILRKDNEYYLITWINWSLQPFGYRVGSSYEQEFYEEKLLQYSSNHQKAFEDIDWTQIRLIALVELFLRNINASRYRLAFKRLASIINIM